MPRMIPADVFPLFETLTPKQHEALKLAAADLTSKQIALRLGVSPVTIDKRIETVRARLGHIARSDLVRMYILWCEERGAEETYDQIIGHPIILDGPERCLPETGSQPSDQPLVFEDSLKFDVRASWERDPVWLRPGLTPSDLGMSGKVFVMLGGAIAILMVAVLSMACINALMSFLGR